MDGDHKNGPKRRQTRRLNWALGMLFFFVFFILYILTNDFLFYLGCIYKAHEAPSSQRRPTQAHKDGKQPTGLFCL